MADSNPTPLSPVSQTAAFPHQTSSSVTTRTPYIDTATPAINAAPVELDGMPTSPEELKRRATVDDAVGEDAVVGDGKGRLVSPGLGDEEDINEEFLGEGERGVGREVREVTCAPSFIHPERLE
jgi:hypothetical protein